MLMALLPEESRNELSHPLPPVGERQNQNCYFCGCDLYCLPQVRSAVNVEHEVVCCVKCFSMGRQCSAHRWNHPYNISLPKVALR
jgi:hypothetical protein